MPVKGARAELERRILEFKTKLDAGDAILPSALPSDSLVSLAGGGVGDVSTPERRDGRRRSPHRGNTVVTWPAVASLPSYDGMGESAPLPNAASTVEDPLQQSDPWKTYMLSTPMTRRSDAAHSGLTPTLESKFQKLDEFLNMAAVDASPPMPQSDDNPVLAAILAGVQNLQRTSVTRDSLKQLVDFQREEFMTMIRAETEPLHTAVGQLHSNLNNVGRETYKLNARINAIESRVVQIGNSGNHEPTRDASDPAYNQVAFLNFPEQSTVQQRIEAMGSFMKIHFPKITPVSTNLFSDKKGEPSVHGYVQFADSKYVKRVIDECKSAEHRVVGFPEVKIKRANSAVDRNRDWALYHAEELIKKHPSAVGKAVVRERGSATRERGVYVDGIRVFEQMGRYTRDGVFLHDFASLHLR